MPAFRRLRAQGVKLLQHMVEAYEIDALVVGVAPLGDVSAKDAFVRASKRGRLGRFAEADSVSALVPGTGDLIENPPKIFQKCALITLQNK